MYNFDKQITFKMKAFYYLLLIVLVASNARAQVVKTDSIKTEEILEENDTVLKAPVLLEEVVIYKEKLDPEALKQFQLLNNRVYKVYPYAKIASERLTSIKTNMAILKTNKEKKKYFKIVEDFIENEFKEKLKKLSRKQGQILVKLIYRQTGISTFDLIKEYKSGWKAFWSNSTARVFDINLKTKYQPFQVNEDYLIETILDRGFNSGRLIRQDAANPVDYDKLAEYWHQKATKKQ